MTKADEERCKKVFDAMMEIILACHDEVGRSYQPTHDDYEVAIAEAYMLMVSAHVEPIRSIDVSAKSIVTIGEIFDLVHEALDRGIIGTVKKKW